MVPEALDSLEDFRVDRSSLPGFNKRQREQDGRIPVSHAQVCAKAEAICLM